MASAPIDPRKLQQVAANAFRGILIRRARAWKALCFDKEGALKPEAKRALSDIAKFSRARRSTFTRDLQGRADPIASARLEGRREVFLRIANYLGLDEGSVQKLVEIDE